MRINGPWNWPEESGAAIAWGCIAFCAWLVAAGVIALLFFL